jgi:hypothetical protein
MQKKPVHQSTPAPLPVLLNGRQQFDSDRYTKPPTAPSVLGHAALLRHPALGRGALPVAALIVGTYAVDERYVIVQAFPIGKQPQQYADVALVDMDPGVTNEPVVWLVI